MKAGKFFAAAALLLASMGMSSAASARDYGHDYRDGRGQFSQRYDGNRYRDHRRYDYRRYDNRRYYGRRQDRRWNNWRNDRRCWTEWRRNHRVRVCR